MSERYYYFTRAVLELMGHTILALILAYLCITSSHVKPFKKDKG